MSVFRPPLASLSVQSGPSASVTGCEHPTRAVTLYYYFKRNLIRNEYISQYGSKALDNAGFYIGDVFILLLSVHSFHKHLLGSD